MPRRAGFRSIRWWAARVVFVVLVAFTAFLAWLWVYAALDKPYQFYHSTDRYCSYIGFVKGRFVIHYDGGPDQGTVAMRNWEFAGVFWKGGARPTGWQELDIGLDGWFAVVFLSVAWLLAAWNFIGVPWRRRRRGGCLRCGYDVRDIPSPVCPECGQTIPRRETAARVKDAPCQPTTDG